MGEGCSLGAKGSGVIFGVGVGCRTRPDGPGQAGQGAVGCLSLQRDTRLGGSARADGLAWLESMLLRRGAWRGGGGPCTDGLRKVGRCLLWRAGSRSCSLPWKEVAEGKEGWLPSARGLPQLCSASWDPCALPGCPPSHLCSQPTCPGGGQATGRPGSSIGHPGSRDAALGGRCHKRESLPWLLPPTA